MTDSQQDTAHTCLMYAQDSKGMGHIVRTLTIARHVLAAFPNSVAYIATESPLTGEFTLPDRCDYVKLPTWIPSAGSPVDGAEQEAAKQRLAALRSQILRDTALGLAPDLVLVDHEPLGHNGEFRDGLRALKAQCPETKFVFGLRDIMDDAGRIRATWQEMGVYEAFENLYDGIAVYGSPNLYDVADAYAIPPSVYPKLRYCGYIVRETDDADPAAIRRQHRVPPNSPLIVASVGAGSDGYPVLEATQAAVKRLQARRPDLRALLVTGPYMPPNHQEILRSRATPTCRVLSKADNFQLMAAADVIVSMGGYNSVCEALSVGRPLVIVPRATHKIEQQIRAETLAKRGLARWIHPNDLTVENLAEALEWALRQDPVEHARAVRRILPSFEGASRLTDFLSQWLGGNGVSRLQKPLLVERPT